MTLILRRCLGVFTIMLIITTLIALIVTKELTEGKYTREYERRNIKVMPTFWEVFPEGFFQVATGMGYLIGILLSVVILILFLNWCFKDPGERIWDTKESSEPMR